MRALIWDLDGTILDSYPVIVDSTLRTLRELGIQLERAETHKFLIDHSVHALLSKIAGERGLAFEPLMSHYFALYEERDDEVTLIPGAHETLERLSHMDTVSFVYTHKGNTAGAVLDRLGVLPYFTEVVTSAYGFPRKPSSEGIRYLLDKYALKREDTFYIGDRALDVDCAVNAGVGSILFLDPNSVGTPTGREDHIVRTLTEIPALFA